MDILDWKENNQKSINNSPNHVESRSHSGMENDTSDWCWWGRGFYLSCGLIMILKHQNRLWRNKDREMVVQSTSIYMPKMEKL